MNNKTAMLNGTIMWATTLVISGWLLASGVSGTFGVLVANVGGAAGEVINQVREPGGASIPNPDQVAQAIPDVSGSRGPLAMLQTLLKRGFTFLIGSLLGLVASLIGSTVGAKKPRAVVR